MEMEERAARLEAFRMGYTRLVDALRQFPEEMWGFKPATEAWSILEIVHHIADAEVNGYVRFRKCIAEPGSAVIAYDGVRWGEATGYLNQPAADSLELFGLLRARTARLLLTVPDEAWAQTIEHPERGTMTLEALLAQYTEHIPEHIDQMWTVYKQWVDQQW